MRKQFNPGGEPAPSTTSEVPARLPAAVWLWLANLEPGGGILLVGNSSPYKDYYQSTWFDEVSEYDPTGEPNLHGSLRLPFGDAAFRAVSIHGMWSEAWTGFGRSHRRLVEECARVLQPSGVLHLTDQNPLWKGFLVSQAPRKDGSRMIGIPSALWRSQARRAGFRRVRTYFLEPSTHFPASVIPVGHRTVRAHQSLGSGSATSRLARTIVRRLGGSDLLYPAVLHLAER